MRGSILRQLFSGQFNLDYLPKQTTFHLQISTRQAYEAILRGGKLVKNIELRLQYRSLQLQA